MSFEEVHFPTPSSFRNGSIARGKARVKRSEGSLGGGEVDPLVLGRRVNMRHHHHGTLVHHQSNLAPWPRLPAPLALVSDHAVLSVPNDPLCLEADHVGKV